MKKYLFLALLTAGMVNSSLAQSWFNLRNGSDALNANAPVCTICTDSGNNIYAAGLFTDDVSPYSGRRQVMKWNATTKSWSQLGYGTNAINANGAIKTLCVDNYGNVYAAGAFDDGSAYHYHDVVKWDGTSWTAIGALQANDVINSICVDNAGHVYAAGKFHTPSGSTYVARWDGTNWSRLGYSPDNCEYNVLLADDSLNVYTGGCFTNGIGKQCVIEYVTAIHEWDFHGTGFDSTARNFTAVEDIALSPTGELYAAVRYRVGGMVFKWTGTTWKQLGDLHPDKAIKTICAGDSGVVYAAGAFTGALGRTSVAVYDAYYDSWSAVGELTNPFINRNPGTPATIYSMCMDKDKHLYAAGEFTDSISPANNYYFVAEYGDAPASLTVTETLASNIEIYPNPAKNTLTINIPGTLPPGAELSVADIYGRVLLTQNLTRNKETIDIRNLEVGLYIYHITNNAITLKTGKLEKY